jgi:hypothetical protein
LPRALFALLLPLALVGCPDGNRGSDDDDDESTEDDRPVLPDPGDAENDWGFELFDEGDVCCAIPEEAYPVGTVTADAGYIQGSSTQVFDSSTFSGLPARWGASRSR